MAVTCMSLVFLYDLCTKIHHTLVGALHCLLIVHMPVVFMNRIDQNSCISLARVTTHIEWYTFTLGKPRASCALSLKVLLGGPIVLNTVKIAVQLQKETTL